MVTCDHANTAGAGDDVLQLRFAAGRYLRDILGRRETCAAEIVYGGHQAARRLAAHRTEKQKHAEFPELTRDLGQTVLGCDFLLDAARRRRNGSAVFTQPIEVKLYSLANSLRGARKSLPVPNRRWVYRAAQRQNTQSCSLQTPRKASLTQSTRCAPCGNPSIASTSKRIGRFLQCFSRRRKN